MNQSLDGSSPFGQDNTASPKPIVQSADKAPAAQQEWQRLYEKSYKQFVANNKIDSELAFDLMAEVYAKESTDVPRNVRDISQMFFLFSVWNPLKDSIVDLDVKDAESRLDSKIREIEKRLIENNVPSDVACFGRYFKAYFQYRQRGARDKLRSALEDEQLKKSANSDQLFSTMRAMYFNQLGLLATQDSMFSDALRFHQTALLFEQQATNSVAYVAEYQNNLGLVCIKLGDFSAAENFFSQSQATYAKDKQEFSSPSIGNLTSQLNLAKAKEIASGSLEFDIPIRNLKKLIETTSSPVRNATDRETKYLQSMCRNNLGLAQYNAGDFKEFETNAEQVHRDLPLAVGEEDISIPESQINLAWAKLVNGKHNEAETIFRSAINHLATYNPKSHRIAEAKSYLARALIKNHSEDPKIIAASRELLESAMDDRHNYLLKTLSTSMSERNRLAFVQNLRLHPESISWPGEFDTYLELATQLQIPIENQYERVLFWKGVLDRNSNADAKLKENMKGLKSIQAALPAKAALIDVIEFRNFHERTDDEVYDERMYGAFVITKEKIRWLKLGTGEAVDSAILEFRGRCSDGLPEVDSKAKQLADLFGNNLQELLGGVEYLLISGDGKTHGLPWSALTDTKVPKQVWADRYQISIVSTAKALLRSGDDKAVTIDGWASMGGVDYGTGTVKPQWPPLDNTLSESQSVDKILRQHFPAAGEQPWLTGNKATRQSLIELLANKNIIHVATHGQFAGDFAGSNSFTIQDASSSLDSALIMANANRDDFDFRDTRLTAEEIGNMKLSQLQLMVMSACETGLGHVRAGQGLVGLTSAFEKAGVKSTVASLWQVDDKATEILMQHFYNKLLETPGQFNVPEALQYAQNQLRQHEKYSHPYYWAPWVVVGSSVMQVTLPTK